MNQNPYNIAECTNCMLHHNQKPLLDTLFKGHVFWVGLSAVKVSSVNTEIPLSINTKSGNLVNSMEEPFTDIQFYRTNLVKCLPLKNEKIRYPTKNEMLDCYSNLNFEVQQLKPKLIFLLGRQVTSFIAKRENYTSPFKFDMDFCYQSFNNNGIRYVPIHHPSYMLIYKRKRLSDYTAQIRRIIRETITLHTLPSKSNRFMYQPS